MQKALIIPAFPNELINGDYRFGYLEKYFPIELVKFPSVNYLFNDETNFPSLDEIKSFIQTLDRNISLIIGEVRSGFIWGTLLRLFGYNAPIMIFGRINPYKPLDILLTFFFLKLHCHMTKLL